MLTKMEISQINELCKNNPEFKDVVTQLEQQQHFTLSRISHELRNPAALINSFLQLFERKHPEITQDLYWIKIIQNMNYLRQLLEDLSSFTHSDKINLESTNIYKILSNTIESIQPTLEGSPIALYFIKETSIPTFPIDSTKIQQVFYNLIRNAKEALSKDRGGTITVAIRSDESEVTIRISDNGCGIKEEYLETLFEPFITHKSEGTGLGLSISKRIIEAHNGTIEVESREGEGTTFTIVLPIV